MSSYSAAQLSALFTVQSLETRQANADLLLNFKWPTEVLNQKLATWRVTVLTKDMASSLLSGQIHTLFGNSLWSTTKEGALSILREDSVRNSISWLKDPVLLLSYRSSGHPYSLNAYELRQRKDFRDVLALYVNEGYTFECDPSNRETEQDIIAVNTKLYPTDVIDVSYPVSAGWLGCVPKGLA